jgi:hypothetical protein
MGLLPLLTGCVTNQSFYGSPVFGKTAPYTAKPLLNDSVHSALYGGFYFSNGAANLTLNDPTYFFQARLYKVRQFRLFHYYYGADVGLGNYGISSYSSDTSFQSTIQSNRYFGNLGAETGADFTLPLGKSEWRMIGLDLSANKEFGSFLAFRKSLVPNLDTGVYQHSFLATLDLSSELDFHTRLGEFGFKYESGTFLGNQGFLNSILHVPAHGIFHSAYTFSEISFHVTYKKWTGYIQEQAGILEGDIKFGLIYRIGSPKR